MKRGRPKRKPRAFSFGKNKKDAVRETEDERAQKERLIAQWLRTHKIKKCPAFMPEPPK